MRIQAALVFVVALNMLFFLGQGAVNDINPSGTQFFNYENSFISEFDSGDYVLDEDFELPTTQQPQPSGIGGTVQNFFTDVFTSIKNWFLGATGIGYLIAIFNAVPNFLASIGLPQQVVFAIGFFWHAIQIGLFVMWLKGN